MRFEDFDFRPREVDSGKEGDKPTLVQMLMPGQLGNQLEEEDLRRFLTKHPLTLPADFRTTL